jgi:hypothetical protein
VKKDTVMEIEILWYQLLIAVGVGMAGVLLAVFLGGWLVFKAKTITMPTPMFMPHSRKSGKPESYLPAGLSEFPNQTDEDLSPAAQRIRDQKIDAATAASIGKDGVLAFVRGQK